MKWLGACLMLFALTVGAAETVSVCFNYGCVSQAKVTFDDGQLNEIGALLAKSQDAAQERQAIGQAIGLLLGWAGAQSPIAADRGGNVPDGGVSGKMDCIDHSTTTTRLLQMIERHGWLRYHRVGEIVLRRRFLLFEHYSAQIEETPIAGASDGKSGDETAGHYVVDSWFFDNGQPAAVMLLARWLAGDDPDDEQDHG